MKTWIPALILIFTLAGCTDKNTDNRTEPKWVTQHQPRTDIALVFVHGIFGDTLGTWGNGDTSFFKLVEKDPEMGPKVDTYAFGYTSKMLGGGSFAIDEAANTLNARLDAAHVKDYPAIVFVTHSMGGLVVMHLLTHHRELLPQVPVMVFYGTPQSGADISRIAQYVSRNEALKNMLPGDNNIYIRTLDESWKSIEVASRPSVHCAYEKLATGGIKIVEWASATRFCDDALAISANHIDIVKPRSAGDDSFLVLQRALEPLLKKSFKPKLETPDVAQEGGVGVVEIDDPFGKKDFNIRNAGGGVLRYSLDQWPNSLHIWPSAGEHALAEDKKDTLQFALAYGAAGTEYKFTLRSNASDPRTVLVRVKNLQSVRIKQAELANNVVSALSAALGTSQQQQALRTASSDEARAAIAQIVHDTVAKSDPNLREAGQWVRAAELLNAVNWPDISATALQNAVKIEPAILETGSVQQLAASTKALGGTSVLDPLSTPAVPQTDERWKLLAMSPKTPFTSDSSISYASALVESMLRIPALKAAALSLQGDVARAKGLDDLAIKSYRDVAVLQDSPSTDIRRRALEMRVDKPIT